MSTIVNLQVLSDDQYSTPVENIVVAIYDLSSTFISQSTTNSSGLVSFTLTNPQYRVYLYKVGFSIIQPWLLNVDLTKISITYSLIGHVRTLPETLNPDLVRVSGSMVDFSGKPRKNLTLQFYREPQVNIGDLIVEDVPVTFTSNEAGYFEFDLYRNMKFCDAYLTERPLFDIETPDRASIELSHLIFPIPVNLAISPTTINVPLSGGAVNVSYTATFSDYSTDREFTSHWAQIKVDVDTSDHISLGIAKNYLTITPLSTGTTTMSFHREFLCDFTWQHAPVFVSPTLTINVT